MVTLKQKWLYVGNTQTNQLFVKKTFPNNATSSG